MHLHSTGVCTHLTQLDSSLPPWADSIWSHCFPFYIAISYTSTRYHEKRGCAALNSSSFLVSNQNISDVIIPVFVYLTINNIQCSGILALFSGPAQLSVACSTEKRSFHFRTRGEPGNEDSGTPLLNLGPNGVVSTVERSQCTIMLYTHYAIDVIISDM